MPINQTRVNAMRQYLQQQQQPQPTYTPTETDSAPSMETPPAEKPGFFKTVVRGVVKPFAKAAVSGVRAVEAIPDTARAVSKAIQGKDFSAELNRGEATANKTANLPVLGVTKTFSGSSNKENLGTALQYGANIIPVARGAGMFASGAVGGAGQTLEDGGTFKEAAVNGAVAGLVNRYAPSLAKGIYNKLPSAVKEPITGAVSKTASTIVGVADDALSKISSPVTKRVASAVEGPLKASLTEDYGKMLNLGQVARNLETKTGKNAAHFLVDEGIPLSVAKRDGRYVLDAGEGLQMAKQKAKEANTLFSGILEGQYKYFNVEDIARAAEAKLVSKGVDREAARKYLGAQILALTEQNADDAYRETGKMMHVANWNKIKQDVWSVTTDFADPAATVKNDANSALGHAIKDEIEKTFKGDIKIQEINQYLGNWSDAIKKLSDRNGKDVRMSRLGRYFNRLGGAAIGTSAGGVAGGVGGAMIADTLTETLSNPGISAAAKQKILERIGSTPEGQQVIQMMREKLGSRFEQMVQGLQLPAPKTVNYTPNVPGSSQNAYGAPTSGAADTIIAGPPTGQPSMTVSSGSVPPRSMMTPPAWKNRSTRDIRINPKRIPR